MFSIKPLPEFTEWLSSLKNALGCARRSWAIWATQSRWG